MGLDQYITSGWDRFVGQATKLGEVIKITWSLTMDVKCSTKALEWMKESRICIYGTG
jgi:hypothetical protein